MKNTPNKEALREVHFHRKRNFLNHSQRLLEVCDDVLRILNSYRQADKARSHTRGVLLGRRQLLMRRACRVDDQALCIPDVCQ